MLSSAELVPAIAEQLKSDNDLEVLHALSELAQLVDTYFGADAEALCDFLRVSGCIAPIARAVGHQEPDIHQVAMLIVGNLGSDAVDSQAEKTRKLLKQHRAFEYLLPHIFSDDWMTLVYSLGAVQNLCYELEYVEQMQHVGAPGRLQELVQCGDQQIEQYARGILLNMRQTIISQATIRQIHAATEKSAAVHIQSSVRRMLAKKLARNKTPPIHPLERRKEEVEQAREYLRQEYPEALRDVGREAKDAIAPTEKVRRKAKVMPARVSEPNELTATPDVDSADAGSSNYHASQPAHVSDGHQKRGNHWRQLQVLESAMTKAATRAEEAEARALEAERIAAAALAEKEATEKIAAAALLAEREATAAEAAKAAIAEAAREEALAKLANESAAAKAAEAEAAQRAAAREAADQAAAREAAVKAKEELQAARAAEAESKTKQMEQVNIAKAATEAASSADRLATNAAERETAHVKKESKATPNTKIRAVMTGAKMKLAAAAAFKAKKAERAAREAAAQAAASEAAAKAAEESAAQRAAEEAAAAERAAQTLLEQAAAIDAANKAAAEREAEAAAASRAAKIAEKAKKAEAVAAAARAQAEAEVQVAEDSLATEATNAVGSAKMALAQLVAAAKIHSLVPTARGEIEVHNTTNQEEAAELEAAQAAELAAAADQARMDEAQAEADAAANAEAEAEAARMEAEHIEAKRLKAERKAERRAKRLEAERLEAERLEAERERLRIEADRIQTERERLEAERMEAERERQEAERRVLAKHNDDVDAAGRQQRGAAEQAARHADEDRKPFEATGTERPILQVGMESTSETSAKIRRTASMAAKMRLAFKAKLAARKTHEARASATPSESITNVADNEAPQSISASDVATNVLQASAAEESTYLPVVAEETPVQHPCAANAVDSQPIDEAADTAAAAKAVEIAEREAAVAVKAAHEFFGGPVTPSPRRRWRRFMSPFRQGAFKDSASSTENTIEHTAQSAPSQVPVQAIDDSFARAMLLEGLLGLAADAAESAAAEGANHNSLSRDKGTLDQGSKHLTAMRKDEEVEAKAKLVAERRAAAREEARRAAEAKAAEALAKAQAVKAARAEKAAIIALTEAAAVERANTKAEAAARAKARREVAAKKAVEAKRAEEAEKRKEAMRVMAEAVAEKEAEAKAKEAVEAERRAQAARERRQAEIEARAQKEAERKAVAEAKAAAVAAKRESDAVALARANARREAEAEAKAAAVAEAKATAEAKRQAKAMAEAETAAAKSAARRAEHAALVRKAEMLREEERRKRERAKAAIVAELAAAEAVRAQKAEEAKQQKANKAAEQVAASRKAMQAIADAQAAEMARKVEAAKEQQLAEKQAREAREFEAATKARAEEKARAMRRAERDALARQHYLAKLAKAKAIEEKRAAQTAAAEAFKARKAEEARQMKAQKAAEQAAASRKVMQAIADAHAAEEMQRARAAKERHMAEKQASEAREIEIAKRAYEAEVLRVERQAEREALVQKTIEMRAARIKAAEAVRAVEADAAAKVRAAKATASARAKEVAEERQRELDERRQQIERRKKSNRPKRSDAFVRQNIPSRTQKKPEAEQATWMGDIEKLANALHEVTNVVEPEVVSKPKVARDELNRSILQSSGSLPVIRHVASKLPALTTCRKSEEPLARQGRISCEHAESSARDEEVVVSADPKARRNMKPSTSLPAIPRPFIRPQNLLARVHNKKQSRTSLPDRPRRAFSQETATSAQRKTGIARKAVPAVRNAPLPVLPPPPKPKDEFLPELDAMRNELDELYGERHAHSHDLGVIGRRFATLGEQYLDRGAPKAALECLQRAVKMVPLSEVASVLSNISVVAMRLNRVELAVRHLQEGLLNLSRTEGMQDKPSVHVRAKLLLNLCVVFSSSKRFHEARDAAEEAVGLLGGVAHDDPPQDQLVQLVVGLYNLCTCYEHLGQYSKAQAAAQRALWLSSRIEDLDLNLLQRLYTVKEEVGAKLRDQLKQAGRNSRVHVWTLQTKSRKAAVFEASTSEPNQAARGSSDRIEPSEALASPDSPMQEDLAPVIGVPLTVVSGDAVTAINTGLPAAGSNLMAIEERNDPPSTLRTGTPPRNVQTFQTTWADELDMSMASSSPAVGPRRVRARN